MQLYKFAIMRRAIDNVDEMVDNNWLANHMRYQVYPIINNDGINDMNDDGMNGMIDDGIDDRINGMNDNSTTTNNDEMAIDTDYDLPIYDTLTHTRCMYNTNIRDANNNNMIDIYPIVDHYEINNMDVNMDNNMDDNMDDNMVEERICVKRKDYGKLRDDGQNILKKQRIS